MRRDGGGSRLVGPIACLALLVACAGVRTAEAPSPSETVERMDEASPELSATPEPTPERTPATERRASPTPGDDPATGELELIRVEIEPAVREVAAVAIAFTADEARGLVAGDPSSIDFEADALICVYVGERPTGGYAVRLEDATLADGVLTVVAEVRSPGPGAMVTQALTYPADCGTVARGGLPDGDFTVRAVDTDGTPIAEIEAGHAEH